MRERFLGICGGLERPVICEVGSRDALDGLAVLEALDGAHLHVFEANPNAASVCSENIAASKLADRVSFVPKAASDSVGTVKFYPIDEEASEQKDPGFSSMFPVSEAYTKRRKKIVQQEVEVEAITLDEYFRDQAPPEVLWIDVEGAEMMVLGGATEILKHVKVVQVEVGFRAMHEGRPLFWDIDTWLKARGFQLECFAEMGAIKSFLARKKLLPNLPWKADAIYLAAAK